MDNYKKETIIKLREDGWQLYEIAKALDMSTNTVKSFCARNNITPKTSRPFNESTVNICPSCGRFFEQKTGHEKRFCSDSCRVRYWRSKQNDLKRK